jgi:ATP-binding cassette subfamily B protein
VNWQKFKRNLFCRVFAQLSFKGRLQLLLSFISVLFNSIAQFLVIATFYPLLSLLTSPASSTAGLQALSFSNSFLSQIYSSSPLFQTTLVFSTLTFLATLLRLFDAWLSQRLAAGIGNDLTISTFNAFLQQPFLAYKTSNSSNTIRILTADIDLFVVAIAETLQFCIAVATSIAIVFALLSLGAKKVIFIVALLCTVFLILSAFTRSPLLHAGQSSSRLHSQKIKIIQEALGSFRDITLDRSQIYFTEQLSAQDYLLRHIRVLTELLSVVPRFFLEGFLLITLAFLAVFLNSKEGSSNSLAFIGVFALGMQRLLPALNLAYASLSNIRKFRAPILDVLNVLEASPFNSLSASLTVRPTCGSYSPNFRSLNVSNLSFAYPDSDAVLRDISFQLDAGNHLAITGSTGSGKSTLLDLLMGLLVPSSGSVQLLFGDRDDCVYDVNSLLDLSVQTNQCFIAHVPQSIFLADTTIAENIAFGISPHNIDHDSVKNAARIAQIAAFIEELPNGYSTIVGESGNLLSGGQRQRLGIARAVYKTPSLLFLDEATSALDIETECAILSNLSEIKQLAVISVAHRASVLDSCDMVLRLHQGTLC